MLPESLHDLGKDPRLTLKKLKVHSTILCEHNQFCSNKSCPVLIDLHYYKLTFKDFDPLHWGGSEATNNFNIGDIVTHILNFCKPYEGSECFLHILRSPWLQPYNITHLMAYLPPWVQKQFYCFLTQRLIHLSSERIITFKHKSETLRRWPCITFVGSPPNNPLDGIFFSYSPLLDLCNENLKITIFEPLLLYLSCLINHCSLIRESFNTFLNSQKHFGLFQSSLHNHTLLDDHWKFEFQSKDFLLFEIIQEQRCDKLCYCIMCKKSCVSSSKYREMFTDIKSI